MNESIPAVTKMLPILKRSPSKRSPREVPLPLPSLSSYLMRGLEIHYMYLKEGHIYLSGTTQRGGQQGWSPIAKEGPQIKAVPTRAT